MTQLKTTRRRPTRVLWRPLHYNAGLSGNLYKWGIQTPVIALAEECNLAEKVIKHFVGLSFLYWRCKPGVELAVGGCREIHPTHKQVKDAPLRPGGAAIRIIVEMIDLQVRKMAITDRSRIKISCELVKVTQLSFRCPWMTQNPAEARLKRRKGERPGTGDSDLEECKRTHGGMLTT
ncbi:hypothetical protein T4D_5531 [Trichinella pseudospiralis]|uniref:Uncharacterized protein n=1 Tax=Trichinella pseudospiralis TaxID=6337 RepID=A0A0V1FKY6_TRIPS|nr:hypothetical protein T4D_5531 [Trichinella pseudospiralis]